MRTPSYFSSALRAALLAVGLAAGPLVGTAQAQRAPAAPVLSLADALGEADRYAFGNRVATATSAADRARARLPLKGILPSARIEAGVIRTTDPIGAFGTTLRQRLVTPAAFDPARLNNPAAVTNAQGGLVLEVPVLNGDAWMGLRAARAAADASDAAGAWTARSTRAQVVRAYYGAILAEQQQALLGDVQQAADAGARQVRSMVAQGLVTKADALQASVRVAEIAAQRLSAQSEARTAREQLALLLGRTTAELPVLPVALPDDAAVLALAAADTAAVATTATDDTTSVTARDDIRAARAGLSAAEADRRRAASTLLPRVNGFARYDWNDPRALYAGQKNWTVGVMASWSLFGGNSELADVAVTGARARAARAGLDATVAQSRVERDAAARRLLVAMQRLALGRDAADQSREAHRLVQKRYDGGLATIAELLAADASATGAALAHTAARYAVIDAVVAWRHAAGADPASLAALDRPSAAGAR
ncbi:MAG: TolC family protein [Gemmatimonadota bacterium]|nr:TolC family protein [Gemmatimonadota bacterium]MDQ8167936.1 TolC family protein [Gemmatimonadota bacterium]